MRPGQPNSSGAGRIPNTGSPGGGIGGAFPGAGFSGPPIQNDPQYAPFQAAYQAASERNEIYAEPILLFIPAAPAIKVFRGAGLLSRLAARVGRGCNCFVAGTEVQTSDGLKLIELISVGDEVLARDELTGQTVFKPVVALIAGSEREIWEVTVETTDTQGRVQREPIGTTDEHPWRTSAGAWLETKDLTPGTELVSADGDRAIVITVLKTDRIEPTYNFEVEGFHTYFVGESGVWVHNACPVPQLAGHVLDRMAQRGVTRGMVNAAIARGQRYFDPKNGSVVHVLAGAMHGGRDLGVAVGAVSGRVSTVMVNHGIVRGRMVPLP
ncbi:polymorphic toxin-type HINT domain-containing protein [Brevundimonas vesicularis]|uniref:polymorphic toxin-type HINT domain-containing protein n=1 Tax=Brevundimonas vesicularis TaxID=41276 RepID=UPI0022ABEBD7|nr:polymorphic toxin-type HINT domain-containing protein [Brevundimonas vesicularis]